MKSFAYAPVLLASIAGVAHADDSADDAALRARLAKGYDGFYDGKLRLWLRDDAALATTPGGAAIAQMRSQEPIESYVLDRQEHAHRVVVAASGARIALWVSDGGVLPAVTREIGLAPTATAKVPGPGADGIFVEPGLKVGERTGDRVHVTYTDQAGATIDGWIPADATGLDYSMDSSHEDGWDYVPAGSKILAGGRAIAVATDGDLVRKLPHGRGELSRRFWLARGKLVLAKGDGGPDGEAGGVEGGVAGGLIGGADAQVADACLYDGAGHLVGAVDTPDLLDHIAPTKDGFDVTVHIMDAETITLHARRMHGTVERCTR
jgi:hypothetical protein